MYIMDMNTVFIIFLPCTVEPNLSIFSCDDTYTYYITITIEYIIIYCATNDSELKKRICRCHKQNETMRKKKLWKKQLTFKPLVWWRTRPSPNPTDYIILYSAGAFQTMSAFFSDSLR